MKKNGFTMVELIAVVTILAVIALIILPSLVGVNRNSEVKKKEENLKNLYLAAEVYIMANYEKCEELEEVNGVCYIYVNTLINNDYINETINPITDVNFTNDDVIKVKRNEDLTFSFELTKLES